jgi:hypothetical protein
MGDLKWDALTRANEMMGETVIDPSHWPTVLDLICEAVGAAGGVLLQTDVPTPDAPRTESFDEMMRRYFVGGWQTRDIRAERGVPLLMRGQRVFTDEDIFTLEELERSSYINECTLPKGFKWAAGVGFMAGPAMWGLCLHRTFRQAPFDARDASMPANVAGPADRSRDSLDRHWPGRAAERDPCPRSCREASHRA